MPITLVPLEVTHRALATEAVIDRIAALGSPVSDMSVALMRYFAETYQRVFGFDAPPSTIRAPSPRSSTPPLVPTRRMNVEVDTTSELSLGRTVCDVYGKTGRAPNVDVAIDLDVEPLLGPRGRPLARYGTGDDA